MDFVRSGVVGTGVNIRGFNSNFNSKNLQVADGRLATLIATGLPMGPLNTQIKEDIERVEVILGPNSALYGPNAHNGLVHIISKDPRTSEGTTIAAGVGNQSLFSVRARHAQVVNDKFSFKLTAEHTQGEEFAFADSVYIDRDLDGVKEGYEEFELDNDFNFNRDRGCVILSALTLNLILSFLRDIRTVHVLGSYQCGAKPNQRLEYFLYSFAIYIRKLVRSGILYDK